MRTNMMVCSARLAWRSPPRLSRWRSVRPEEAGTGAAAHRWAKEASLFEVVIRAQLDMARRMRTIERNRTDG